MWTTFSKQQSTTTQKTVVPGDYGTPETVTIPETTGGIELVPEDLTNTVRFVNLSVAPTADNNGDPISIYVGVGMIPTATLYSIEMLSGQNEYNLQINSQAITAICETGKTLNVNVQIANAAVKVL